MDTKTNKQRLIMLEYGEKKKNALSLSRRDKHTQSILGSIRCIANEPSSGLFNMDFYHKVGCFFRQQ